jgi:hypothetical protein
MKINYFYTILILAAFICGSCNITHNHTAVSNPNSETGNRSFKINPAEIEPAAYQPSAAHNEENSEPSNEIVYYSSIENATGETVLAENDLIITPKNEILPDTLPDDEWLSQSQLARESKIAGIWGLAIFFILPYIAVVFGIIAIAKGRRAQKTIAKSPEKYINAGDAMAGVIMGSIVVGLFVLAVLILTVYLMALSGILNLPNW